MFLRQNRDYLDWWLMQKFPGRTLEELDGIDWLRLQRAQEVGRIVSLEEKHALFLERKLTADKFTSAEWRQVQQHNVLYEGLEAEREAAKHG